MQGNGCQRLGQLVDTLPRSALFFLCAAAAGCGGKSSPDGAPSHEAGGTANLGVGGASSAISTGGFTFGGRALIESGGSIGGTSSVAVGGAAPGGKSYQATGGITGGSTTGGTFASAHGGAAAGAAFATGGAKPIGQGGAAGGISARSSGGAAAGGSTAGTASAGIAGTAGVAGAGLADFCVGDTNQVSYAGQNLTPAAFNYDPMVAMNCCDGIGVGLHTRDTLGFDLALEIIYPATASGTSAGEYVIARGKRPSISLDKLGAISSTAVNATSGNMLFTGNMFAAAPWWVGLCLVVDAASPEFAGTRIYVARATMMPYGWAKRLQIFPLADSTTTPSQAQSIGLAALTLATTAWLDLRQIAYVEQAAGKFDMTLASLSGNSLRSQLASVTVQGRPFVVVADDVPIYLGTFFQGFSSIAPVGPFIQIETITDDRVPISAPMNLSSDPRADARITAVLSESGKLVP